MSRIFVISDTHFGHANILRFTDANTGQLIRPGFSSVEEMDRIMEERWNDTIGDSDIVYHLGDFGFNQNSLGTILPRLKGRKRLILGNHDNGKNPDLQKYFQKISVWRMFPEYDCVLTHVPLHESSMYKVKLNLHGHIHQNPAPTSRHVNCCVELQNYTPRLIEDIITDHSNR